MLILKTRNLRWFVLMAVCAIALTVGIGVEKYAATKKQAVAILPAVIDLLPEEVVTAQFMTLEHCLKLHGHLRAFNEANLKAKSIGEVTAVLVREGERVKTGQILVRIDPVKSELGVAQAESVMRSAQGQLDIALKNRDNNKLLVDQGFISTTSYQNAESQYASAKANVESYRAALNLARQALNDTVLRAPIDGVVAARLVDVGDQVFVDTPLLNVADVHVLELVVAVPAINIEPIHVGQEMQILPEGAHTPFVTSLLRINPVNQAGSRSYLVYAQLANLDERLRAGLFAEVKIMIARKNHALSIPKSALYFRNGQTLVYTLEQGKLVEKSVQTGFDSDQEDGMIEITQGLAAEMLIVRRHLGRLVVGSPVRIRSPKIQPPLTKVNDVVHTNQHS